MIVANQPLDHRDHLLDVPRRPRHQLRLLLHLKRNLQPQRTRIIQKRIRIKIRNRIRIVRIKFHTRRQFAGLLRLQQPPRRHLHLVLAPAISHIIIRHVPHIRDVHHMRHRVSKQLQRPPQHIRIQKRSKVPNMRIVINRRPAGIETNLLPRRIQRHKILFRLGQRVVKPKCHW